MVVTDEHDVDRRQIAKPQTGRPMPPRPEERHRRATLRPDRIGQDVEVLGLQQQRRVIHPRHAHPPTTDARHRRRPRLALDPPRPEPRLPLELPFQKRPLRLPRRISIPEPLPIKMIRHRPAVPRRRDQVAFDGDRTTHDARADRHVPNDLPRPTPPSQLPAPTSQLHERRIAPQVDPSPSTGYPSPPTRRNSPRRPLFET